SFSAYLVEQVYFNESKALKPWIELRLEFDRRGLSQEALALLDAALALPDVKGKSVKALMLMQMLLRALKEGEPAVIKRLLSACLPSVYFSLLRLLIRHNVVVIGRLYQALLEFEPDKEPPSEGHTDLIAAFCMGVYEIHGRKEAIEYAEGFAQ